MATMAARDLLDEPEKVKVAKEIADRLSEELVFALVGPVGSGVFTAASLMKLLGIDLDHGKAVEYLETIGIEEAATVFEKAFPGWDMAVSPILFNEMS